MGGGERERERQVDNFILFLIVYVNQLIAEESNSVVPIITPSIKDSEV